MKRIILFLVISAAASGAIYSQNLVIPNKPYAFFNSSPGYITINEFAAGMGLTKENVPFSKSFFGFNTIHSYQINRNFILGAGTGIYVYNGGGMVPIFMDFRFNFSIQTLTPFFSGDGGLLVNPEGTEKIFINPGAGVRYALDDNICLTFGAGYFIQVAETQNSFVSFRLGLTFKP